MKTLVKTISVALLLFSLSSCMKEPMACFDAKTSAAINEEISFNSSCSMDSHEYEWTFGDGITSTEANPKHAYSKAGTFTVTLMTMSKNGKKMNETSKSITVQ